MTLTDEDVKELDLFLNILRHHPGASFTEVDLAWCKSWLFGTVERIGTRALATSRAEQARAPAERARAEAEARLQAVLAQREQAKAANAVRWAAKEAELAAAYAEIDQLRGGAHKGPR